jgi:prolyl oligopeptidase
VLITAGERDERAHPLHARKMAARLQAATSGDPETRPILLWVERDTGHGYGTPADLQRAEAVDQIAFQMWGTKMGEACQNVAKTSR